MSPPAPPRPQSFPLPGPPREGLADREMTEIPCHSLMTGSPWSRGCHTDHSVPGDPPCFQQGQETPLQ